MILARSYDATLSRTGMKNGFQEIEAITINISCVILWVWGLHSQGCNSLPSKEPHLDGEVKSSRLCADSQSVLLELLQALHANEMVLGETC